MKEAKGHIRSLTRGSGTIPILADNLLGGVEQARLTLGGQGINWTAATL
jgi:hypothetical protein